LLPYRRIIVVAPISVRHRQVFCIPEVWLLIEPLASRFGTLKRGQRPRLGARVTGDVVESHPFHRGAITGIVDWIDAAIADPAWDFALLYRDLGNDALAAMLDRYDRSRADAVRERILSDAQCGLIGDIAYGLTGGDPI
jgi:hypothetical protein